MANPETPTTRITIGGYEAAILVDSKEVEHYKIEVDYQTKSATCWIASEEGKVRWYCGFFFLPDFCCFKHFAILLRKAHKLFDCVCKLKLDGHRINGHLIYKREVSPHIKSSVSVDQSTARRFVFAALKVTGMPTSVYWVWHNSKLYFSRQRIFSPRCRISQEHWRNRDRFPSRFQFYGCSTFEASLSPSPRTTRRARACQESSSS